MFYGTCEELDAYLRQFCLIASSITFLKEKQTFIVGFDDAPLVIPLFTNVEYRWP